MDLTICSKVTMVAASNLKYGFDLLLALTVNGGHNVSINPPILKEYEKISLDPVNELIRTWIMGMDYKGLWKAVHIDKFNKLFIDTCRLTHDKTLIVSDKEDYDADDYEGLTVYNKDQAIINIKPASIKIIQIGTGNIASAGNNSPIIGLSK